MNTTSIERALGILLDIPFYVIAANELHLIPFNQFPVAIVQNTSERLPGQHWIAWIVYNKEREGEYFDSYGYPISKYRLVQRPVLTIVKENCKQIQQSHSFVCGQMCIFFLYHRLNGVSYEAILQKFRNSRRYNDFIVQKFVDDMQSSEFHKHSLYETDRKCVLQNTCKLALPV